MGQVLHANARTTEETRKNIQNSEESLIKPSDKYDVNPKTIIKWKKRDFTHDAKMGPKKIKSTPIHCGVKHLRTLYSKIFLNEALSLLY